MKQKNKTYAVLMTVRTKEENVYWAEGKNKKEAEQNLINTQPEDRLIKIRNPLNSEEEVSVGGAEEVRC